MMVEIYPTRVLLNKNVNCDRYVTRLDEVELFVKIQFQHFHISIFSTNSE